MSVDKANAFSAIICSMPGGSFAPEATSFSIFSSFALISASASTTRSVRSRDYNDAVLVADHHVARLHRDALGEIGNPIGRGRPCRASSARARARTPGCRRR